MKSIICRARLVNFSLRNTISNNCIESKEVYIEKLDQCSNGEPTIVEISNVLLNYQQTTMTANAQINIKSQIGGSTNILILLTKCKDKRERDTCELYSRHNIPATCRQLLMKNRIWSDFVGHIEGFPKQCPLAPGLYNLTNASVDLKNMAELPLNVGYWKITADGKLKKQSLFCVEAELDIQQHKRRKH